MSGHMQPRHCGSQTPIHRYPGNSAKTRPPWFPRRLPPRPVAVVTLPSHTPLLTPHRSFPRGPAARKSLRMSGPNRSHWGRLLQGWLPAAGAAPQEGGPSRRCGRQRRAHKPRLRGNSSTQLRPYSGGSRHIPGPQGLTRTREHPF